VDTLVTRTLDLRDYGRIVRASSRLIVATAALVGILSATYVLVRGPEYTATARVLVESIVNPAIGDLSGQAATVLQPVMSTETQVAQSVEVASSVKETTGLPESPQQLLSALEIENIRDTTVLLIKYTDPDPGRAARLANAFARQYLDLRREQVRESVSVGRDALLARLNGTDADRDGKPDDRDGDGLADDGLRTELAQALERLQGATGTVEKGLAQVDVAAANAQISEINSKLGQIDVLIATSQGGRLVSRAITPTSPSSPSVIFAALVGAVFGALIGAAGAIARKVAADRVAGHTELSDEIGAQVIGVIPAVAGWQERRKERLVTRDEPTSPAAEAYRTLATNIRFIGSKQRLQVLMLTSSLPEEGKTSTASNLAVVLAQSGLRTILVDSDLRRPRVDRFLGVGHGAGLREALEGWTDLVDVIQMSDVPGLAVLRSGEAPPDPAALLSSPAAQKVLADLRKAADIVICDAPPVLPVADASVLAPHMDGVLFVHDPSIAPRTALLDAVRQLRTAGGDVIGGVYNNVSKSQRTYLGYSRYEAYYGGDRTSEAQPSWIPGRLTLQRPDRPDGDGRERPAERAGRGSGA
jgi:capsular exopolysaccharide synthesis family protein